MGQVTLVLSTGHAVGLNAADQTFDKYDEGANYSKPTFEGWSDGELVAGVVIRSNGAFTELFRRHYRSVVASSRMILASLTESEDVGAEVFLNFWLEPEKFDPNRGTLVSFLRLKAKGRSIDLIRAETSRSRREQYDTDCARTVELGVDTRVLSAEYITRLRVALSQLPLDERQPIELAFFGGLAYIAVAQHLGLPEGTVKARIRNGLGRLRAAGLDQDIAYGQDWGPLKVSNPSLARSVREHEGAR